MKPIRVFTVVPSLPVPIEGLRLIAYNLRWAWSHEAIELFRRLDSDLWEACGHNPVAMLGSIDQSKLDAAAVDDAFLAHLDRVQRNLEGYIDSESSWFRKTCNGRKDCPLVAYFSAEFGLTECLSIFAGGLGILAGDHLKSASDIGVPLVGVGLLYQQGYFQQCLTQAGWQQESYADNDFHNLPVSPAVGPDGKQVVVEVSYPGRAVRAQVWRVAVGRVSLYLLDTNVASNRPEDRDITDQLYGGDRDMRIRQEILLGIGGYHALAALGIEPTVYHMNEGHSAFLGLERVRRLMEKHKLSFAEARELASASLIFTTHTPVEAGHDYFPPDLMDYYLGDYSRRLGLSRDEFLALGRRGPWDQGEFCMTVLALRLASFRNGVSKLHGAVSRRMWQSLWPGVPVEEVPIRHITNGVHFRSWISAEMNHLYDRYLGPNWRDEPSNGDAWGRIHQISAEELWRTHERRRERLVAWARRRVRNQRVRRGAPQSEIEAADEVLDPDALTIGFARRFATYKRATLLLRDLDRLKRLLTDPTRPVQLIFAGKAHPRDTQGKELIQQIVSLSRQPELGRRLVFLEDYDMAVARYLVQGVDVWLNTPQRPLEASGTSGMKAAANGALNLSTLDGWWDEVWRDPNRPTGIGWAIGSGEDYEDHNYQDQVEAESLYELLEADIVPAFYDRGPDRMPRRWVNNMKASIGTLCQFVNTHRMVSQYTTEYYLVAHARAQKLGADNAAGTRALAAWTARVQKEWPRVRVEEIGGGPTEAFPVGTKIRTRARLELGGLSAEDVTVELYWGRVNAAGEISEGSSTAMKPAGCDDHGKYLFETDAVAWARSGLHGYTVRVVPHHPDLASPFLPGLITWAEAGAAVGAQAGK